MDPDEVLFAERQPLRVSWLAGANPLLAVLLLPAYASFGLIDDETLQLALRAVVAMSAVTVAIVLLGRIVVHMRTVVTARFLNVHIFPFFRRTVVVDDVAGCELVSYDPREYGGRGNKWKHHKGRAYTMSGDRGVLVKLHRGEDFLLGSERPEQLWAAIESARQRAAARPSNPLRD